MSNSLALREVLLGGTGIARMPTFVVGQDVRAGRLRSIFTNYENLQPSIYLVYPRRKHLSPKVRILVDFLAQRVTDLPYRDQGGT